MSHDGYFDNEINPWEPKRKKDEHDETIERLYNIISSGPKEKVKDRLMSELRNNFPHTPSSSKILSRTNGMRIVEEQKREAQNKANQCQNDDSGQRATYQMPDNGYYHKNETPSAI